MVGSIDATVESGDSVTGVDSLAATTADSCGMVSKPPVTALARDNIGDTEESVIGRSVCTVMPLPGDWATLSAASAMTSSSIAVEDRMQL